MRTTTDPKKWLFTFTISDAARFLGKSPVTLRQWERKGLVSFPRAPEGNDRQFTCGQIRDLAYKAHELGRISKFRLHSVIAAVQGLEYIERENQCQLRQQKSQSSERPAQANQP